MSELKQIQAQKTDVAFKKDLAKQQLLCIEEFLDSDVPDKNPSAFRQYLQEKEYDKLIPAKVQNYDNGKLERYAEWLDEKIDKHDDEFDVLEEREESFLGEKDFCCFTDEDSKNPDFKQYFNASEGKSRRQKRREIRKTKRKEKDVAKKAWKAAGKKGGNKGWIKIKKEIKKKEREALALYGGTFGGRLWRGLKKFNPALVTMRNAALALIKVNFWNVATKLSKAKEKGVNNARAFNAWVKALARWGKFGGDKDSLEKAVNVGKNKKPIKISFRKKANWKGNKFDGTENKEYFNVIPQAIGVALITAGGSVIVALLSALKGTGDSSIEPDADLPYEDEVYDSTEGADTGSSYQEQYDAIMNDPDMTAAEKAEAIEDLKAEEGETPQWLITAGYITAALVGVSLIVWGVLVLVKHNKKAKTA